MKKNTKIGIVVLMLVAMLAVTGVILNQPAYAFKMDVNPSIEIKANRLDRVVEIIPLNEDARNLLKDFKLTDKSLEKTIEDLADLMVLKGYISGGKDNLVMITVNDENTNQKVVEGLNKAIKAYLENKQIEATIVNQAISENNNNNQNKSGKEIIANRIKYIDDDTSIENLSNMTLSDLVRYAEEKGINPEKLFKTITKTIESENKLEVKVEDKSDKKQVISEEKAKKIALGVVNGTIIKVELEDENDDDDDSQEYEIKIQANGKKYEIKIDAITGKVTEVESNDYDDDDDKKIVNLNKENVNANKDHENKKSSGKIISREEAKNIALGLVNGTIVEFELDEDDGRQEYEIEIIANGIEYEIEIDASTGKVLEFESDDYDDDDRDDD